MRGFIIKIVYCLFFVSAACLLTSCQESSQESSNASAGGGKKVSVNKKKPINVKKKKAEEEKVVEYRYSRIGKVDPFEPLVKVVKKAKNNFTPSDVAVEELTPLQKVEINSLKLLGIIIGKGAPRAMVDAPDKKSYILKAGTKVGKNDGVVIEITVDTVYVKEKYQDFSGEVHENIVEIKLPGREGDL